MVERRQTNQRQWVLSALRANGHMSALDIYNKVRAEHPDISVATVYRNLGILAEDGQIQAIGSCQQKEVYDIRTDIHAHFICQNCGLVFDVEVDAAACADLTATLQAAGHQVNEKRITWYGICRDCRQATHEKEESNL
jgi:Fur family peroxide stress response transcriptional regulator